MMNYYPLDQIRLKSLILAPLLHSENSCQMWLFRTYFWMFRGCYWSGSRTNKVTFNVPWASNSTIKPGL